MRIPAQTLFRTRDLTGSQASVALDAADRQIAAIVNAHRAGAITHCWIPVTAVTGTAPQYKAAVHSVVSYDPGAILSAGSEALWTAASSSVIVAAFATPVTVTAGQTVALVLSHHNGTISSSHCVTVAYRTGPQLVSLPNTTTATAGAWTRTNFLPRCALVYADGSLVVGSTPNLTTGSTTLSTGGLGLRWTQAGTVVCCGVEMVARLSNTSSVMSLTLLQDGSVVRSSSLTAAVLASNQNYPAILHWDTLNLVDGSSYELRIEPTTSSIVVSTADFGDTTTLSGWLRMPGAGRTLSGATWSDTAVVPLLSPLICDYAPGGRPSAKGFACPD